jgi:hypothetical protein
MNRYNPDVISVLMSSILAWIAPADAERMLAEGRLGVARDALEQRIAIEPDDWRTLNALAVTLAQQGLREEALVTIDRAHRVRPDVPEIVNNVASLALASGDGLRAVRVLSDYLRAHRTAPHEFLVHALTIALERSTSEGRSPRSVVEAQRLRAVLIGKLEAARPGERIQGVTWLEASLAESRERASREAVNRVRELLAFRSVLESQHKSAEERRRRLAPRVERQLADPLELDAIDRDIAVTRNRLERNAQAIADAFEQIEVPAVPFAINLRLPDGTELTDAMPTGAPTALTSGVVIGPRAVIADARAVAEARRVELRHADGEVVPAAVRRVDLAGWALLETQRDLASPAWMDRASPGPAEAWAIVSPDADAPMIGSIGCELVMDGEGLSLTFADEPPSGVLALMREEGLIGLVLTADGTTTLIASDHLSEVRRAGRRDTPPESAVWLVASWRGR